ncbi:formimidoylglutamase [Corynebacterium nasicanis]|uniref:Formimidoylglutamase n=1 Tax=Corynebacterium nasicanis TaxID=1448267 RepID=A0ABW1QAK3_9CORY
MNPTSPSESIHVSEWSGRHDGPGPEHARWHSSIQRLGDHSPAGVALLGFSSDEGVRRNGGRQGAAEGPQAIRDALASMAVHHDMPLYDAGTIAVHGTDLETGHDLLSAHVRDIVAAGHLTIVLGGGHETAFGTHRGLRSALDHPVAIVNLDAHFDLRQADRPTSGTPFRQIADLDESEFHYSVFGISRPSNTRTLFDTAADLGAQVITDEDIASMTAEECAAIARESVAELEVVHLSIDLDVLPAATAPGVSAPAAFGVELQKILSMARALASTGKLRLVDVVELNPHFDVDNRTARVAARIIDEIVRAASAASNSELR